MANDIFNIIANNAMNERLDRILRHDKQYADIQSRMNEVSEMFDRLELTEEERQTIDQLISVYNENSAYYAIIAYKQGFKDSMSLHWQCIY